MKKQFKLTRLASSLALPILLSAYAVPSAVAAEEAKRLTLEEVVVTARRRTESLQDIPDSVTALSADVIENAGIGNLQDISKLVPNLSLFAGEQGFRAGVLQLVVRGITTPQNGEAPLSFVVDGVTVPEIDFINQDLINIESVQVLRGPQGALYGRGALGGAILINTKQPTNETSGFVKASYEEGNDKRVTANVSGALTEDKLFYKLTASVRDRDGQIENVTVNEDTDFHESTIIKGGLKYVASDAVEVDWNFNVLESDLGGGAYGVVPSTSLNNADRDHSVIANILGENSRDIFETSLKVEWDLGFAQLTSVTAYADIDDDLFSDGDFTEIAGGAQRNATKVESFTQELRLTSNDDQSLRWILGAFYQDRSKEFEFDFAFDDRGLTSGAFADRFTVVFEQKDNTDTESVGIFGQVNYDITDKLELTAALRYDDDERDFADPRTPINNGTTGSDELQPKFSLSYDVSDNTLAYVTYAHGYRSGGFNEVGFGSGDFTTGPTTYKEENSDSIEAGFKTTLLDGLMTFNAALYHTTLENNQFFGFDLATFTIGLLNIEDAEVTGLDLEIAARPTEALDLTFGLGISDSEIKDLDGTGSFSGNTIPYVPDYTLNFGAQYTWALSNADLIARLDYSKIGELHFDQANVQRRDATDNLNLRLAWKNDTWSLAAYLDNATDERVIVESIGFIDATRIGSGINSPRAAGVEVIYKF